MKRALKIVMMVALIAVTAAILFACVPTNIEKATAKMEKAGYTVVSFKNSADGYEGGFSATKISIGEGSGTLNASYFKDCKSAKEYYNKIYSEDNETKKEDRIVKCSGRWVYFGTKAAVEAFEK